MAAGAGPKTKGGHAKRETATPPLAPAGLAAREAAVRLIAAVMHKRHSLDDALAKEFASDALAPRDRALARLIAGTVLRHAGELKAHSFLGKTEALRANSGRYCWPVPRSFCFSRHRRTPLSASPWSKRGSIRGQSDMTGSSMRYCGAFHVKALLRCRIGMRHAIISPLGCLTAGARPTARPRRAASRSRRSARHRSTSA